MTKAFMITYDLNNPGQRYEELIRAIKDSSTGVWCTYWKSSFLIKSNLSTIQILDNLKPYLDTSDSLIIIEVVNNKNGWLNRSEWDYINKNIF